jgi:hypothetical protein
MADNQIVIDLDKMTIDDIITMDGGDTKAILTLLDDVVDGGIRHLPITHLPKIKKAFRAAIDAVTNEGN